ncbi:hypothetical protein OG453_07630 [Streptomyces sp. NBC_01381]|uniref:hypothetical protein n=1 Tax=Streptomyces sp. NBC_01381 TaxID=2903845 RepID=UPI002253B8C3|nr:hypothetical protein [Streptomyces sp. NBC_01381]MCX4666540.1 hypothetical protein [Streptomyces sp. NBC_01381]
MKRSALVIATLVLGAVACDGSAGDGKNANSTPSAKAKPPVTADEARRILKDLDKKDDSDSLSPAYWRKVHEGPWLDRTLARVDNIKKLGKDDSSLDPTNRPHLDPAVHAWVAKPASESSGDWILGAQQVSSHTIGGEFKNKASMYWSLSHRGDAGGAWRTAFTAYAPKKKDLPQVAADKSGRVRTVAPNADLAVQPGKACGVFLDYITRKDTDEKLQWSSQIDTYRATHGDTKPASKQLNNPESVELRAEGQRTPIGPAWQTKDGGALVACVGMNTAAADMGAGRWIKFTTSGWDGTTGIRWNKFTQTMMTMIVLNVPADGAEISIAAQTTWPYKFDGTKYNGA